MMPLNVVENLSFSAYNLNLESLGFIDELCHVEESNVNHNDFL